VCSRSTCRPGSWNMLEDVCIYNNGIFEVLLQDPLQQVASINTTIISSKLNCFITSRSLIQHLLEIIRREQRRSSEEPASSLTWRLSPRHLLPTTKKKIDSEIGDTREKIATWVVDRPRERFEVSRASHPCVGSRRRIGVSDQVNE